MKLVFVTLIRCADWRRKAGIIDLERLQLRILRQQLGLESPTEHDKNDHKAKKWHERSATRLQDARDLTPELRGT